MTTWRCIASPCQHWTPGLLGQRRGKRRPQLLSHGHAPRPHPVNHAIIPLRPRYCGRRQDVREAIRAECKNQGAQVGLLRPMWFWRGEDRGARMPRPTALYPRPAMAECCRCDAGPSPHHGEDRIARLNAGRLPGISHRRPKLRAAEHGERQRRPSGTSGQAATA